MSSLLLLCVIALKNTLQEKIPRMHYLTLQEEYMIFTTLMVALSLLMSATQFTYSCATRTALDSGGGILPLPSWDDHEHQGEGGSSSGWGWGGQCVHLPSLVLGTVPYHYRTVPLKVATGTIIFAVAVLTLYHTWLFFRLRKLFVWRKSWAATGRPQEFDPIIHWPL
jgi:hypothetical protein